jgi:hypothetical protein
VIFFGVVSSQTEKALELFLERAQAEAFIAEVEQDEPETAALLRVEPVDAAARVSAQARPQAPRTFLTPYPAREEKVEAKRELTCGDATRDVVERDARPIECRHEADEVHVGRTKPLILFAGREDAEIDQLADILKRRRDELGELLFGERGHERDSMLPRSGLPDLIVTAP